MRDHTDSTSSNDQGLDVSEEEAKPSTSLHINIPQAPQSPVAAAASGVESPRVGSPSMAKLLMARAGTPDVDTGSLSPKEHKEITDRKYHIQEMTRVGHQSGETRDPDESVPSFVARMTRAGSPKGMQEGEDRPTFLQRTHSGTLRFDGESRADFMKRQGLDPTTGKSVGRGD